jgi:hypothetical protein
MATGTRGLLLKPAYLRYALPSKEAKTPTNRPIEEQKSPVDTHLSHLERLGTILHVHVNNNLLGKQKFT